MKSMSDYYLTYFFATCIRRLELSLDLSGWDTVAVTDMTICSTARLTVSTSIDTHAERKLRVHHRVYGSMFTNNNLG